MQTDICSLFMAGTVKDGYLCLPGDSYAILFVLEYCQDLPVKICLVPTDPSLEDKTHFPVKMSKLNNTIMVIEPDECPEMIQMCHLPAVINQESTWCVAGLCSSLRYILKRTAELNPDHFCKELLGFRNGCLQACAEVSVWTKFCESEVVNSLDNLFSNTIILSVLTFPSELLRFEEHMKRPPILHNALKQKQNHIKKSIKSKENQQELFKKKLSELPDLEHKFAEGLTLTLADVILFSCFHIMIHYLKIYVKIEDICPLLSKWHLNLLLNDNIKQSIHYFDPVLQNMCIDINDSDISVIYPEVPKESLYKSDPERYNPKSRAFTHQSDIEMVLKKLENSTHIDYSTSSDKNIHKLNWADIPTEVSPVGGELPLSRLERKQSQLSNMCAAISTIAKENDVIVDFCAGGGHLGILLAYLLPKCTVLLVENKEASLERAVSRANDAKLDNLHFYQCNLRYFKGSFNIGTSLHACGTATDLTMQKCIESNASFVCCPCCYGAVNSSPSLFYPRSALYQNLTISLDEYLTLGHAADQTHSDDNPKTVQGRLCMKLIDYDRLLFAENNNYKTQLVLMKPYDCSPKNHILVGVKVV